MKLMTTWLLPLALYVSLVGCRPQVLGPTVPSTNDPSSTSADANKAGIQAQIDALKKNLLALSGTQQSIQSVINSDYASCPKSGDTADPLINKICVVAQAASVEARVQMKSELGTYSQALSSKITTLTSDLADAQTKHDTDQTATNDDITAINAALGIINTTIISMQTSITTLTGQMTSANTSISALQGSVAQLETLTSSLQGAVSGALQSLDIGVENTSAGPMYESILRATDKSRINAYVETNDNPSVAISNNGFAITNGSKTVTITTATAHALVIGDSVLLSGSSNPAGGTALTSTDLTGSFQVLTVPSSTTFTIAIARNAAQTTNVGGNNALMLKVNARGLGTIWVTANGADASVRTTTTGTTRYNFIIKANGSVCYSKTSATATFAIISAVGSDIVCK